MITLETLKKMEKKRNVQEQLSNNGSTLAVSSLVTPTLRQIHSSVDYPTELRISTVQVSPVNRISYQY